MSNQNQFNPLFITENDLSVLRDGPIQLGFTRNKQNSEGIKAIFPKRPLIELNQIHGNIIISAETISEAPFVTPQAGALPEGDGLYAQNDLMLPIIRTADCIPLFFWHRYSSFYGILHVGWRGFVALIHRKLLEISHQNSVNNEDLVFLIGPSICPQHYPVGKEVIAQFESISSIPEITSPTEDGRFFLNLKKALRLDLLVQGISAQNIFDPGICTTESLDLPSYRREKNGSRIYNFITRG